MYRLNYFSDWLSAAAWWKLLAGFIVIAILYNALSVNMAEYFFDEEMNASSLEGLSPVMLFVVAVLVGPFIETLLFQYLIIETINYFTKGIEFISLAISALAFALVHSYSSTYIMFMLVPGVLLAVLYLVFIRKKQSAFWMVYLAHAFINMFTLLHNRLD